MSSAPQLRPIEHDDEECLLTKEDFIEDVRMGGFIDDDGVGEFATADQVSTHEVYPSDISFPGFVWPEWATHVLWYNK
jgi:hypothetical protein